MGLTYGQGQTPDEYIARQSRAQQPRLAGTRITHDNLMDTLKSVNVSDEALESTAKAVQAVSSIPGMMVEAREGRLIASTAGQEAFELPVFQRQNILTKGGTRFFTIGSVTNFDATGQTSTNKSFANWFNQTISDLASVTGDAKERRISLQDQVGRVFGQLGKDGDGARAMVEPLSSGGRPQYGQAVAKQSVTAFHFPAGHQVTEALVGMKEAALDVIKSVGRNKDVKQKFDIEQGKRLSYAQKLYAAANASQPGTLYSDTVFSVTSKSIIDPLVDQKGAFPMLTSLQPNDLVLFGDHTQAAKGFSQIRHAAFITHDKLGVAGATSRETRAGVPSAIKADRMTPVVQTRARFELDRAASAIEGKAGTFSPMGKVAAFVDPAMADAFLKDSGGIRSHISHINDPAMSTMSQIYTKSIAVNSTDELMLDGLLTPKLQQAIKDQLKNLGNRASRQTLEFGSYVGQHRGLGLSLDDEIIGFNVSSDSPDGIPSALKAGKKKVSLDDARDTIEGIKIRHNGTIELSIKRAAQRGSAAGSLLVGESGRRVTASRTADLRMEGGGAFDLLADLQMFDQAADGTFILSPSKGAHNTKSGDFYRRQFQTIAGRVEKRFGRSGLEMFAESFGLSIEDRFGSSPTLIAEPDLTLDYKKGLGNFRVAVSKAVREQLGTSEEVKVDKVFKELTEVEVKKLDKNVVKGLLTERGFIDRDGIIDPNTNEKHALNTVKGSQLFEGYRTRMQVAVFDDIIVERQDRVTGVGIKADGRSAAQLKASRLGYVKESVTTRGMVASQAVAKVLNDFNNLVINQGMVKSNPFVFDELKKLADPFMGGNKLGTGSSAQSIYATRGGGVDLADFRAGVRAGTPVPLHMLHDSFYYDQTIEGLSKTGVTLDLGHNVALGAGRMGSSADGIIPRGVEASKIYIPSPASVLNSGADESVFLRPSGGLQGTYVELIDAISGYGKTGKPLTKGEADRVGALYNKFQLEFAEDQLGKGKSISKAALNPTFARYGALGSLPHLKADTVGLTEESLMEMLDKSQFKGEMRERILERAKKGELKLGFLADPMGSREHYRGVSLQLLKDTDITIPTPKGSRPDTKSVIYLSESLLKMANRDLDADHATISLLSSITEHIQEMGKAGSEDLFELEQRALRHLYDGQAASIGDIEKGMFTSVKEAFGDFFNRGEVRTNFSMEGAGRLVGETVGPEAQARITLGKTDPTVRTPVPEVWWQKQSGIDNLIYQKRLEGRASSRAQADTVSEVVSMIMARTDKKGINEKAISDLIEVMMQSQGNASQYHNAIKYGLLLKTTNMEGAKADATMAFWADLENATKSYRGNTNLSQLATDELTQLTDSILGVMTGGEYAPGMDDARTKQLLVEAKHPVGYAAQDAREFARVTARELVASDLVSELSGYKNPYDVVAKGGASLLGTADGYAGQEPKVNRAGGAIVEAVSYQERLLGETPSHNLADDLADAESYDGRARARAGQAGIDPTRFAEEEAASRAAGSGSSEGPTGRIDYDQLKEGFNRFKADMSGYWSGLDETVRGRTKLGLGIAAGVAGVELVRATVSGFVGPGHATPTAPMPPQPLLSEPNDPTFDSRALPQHNRTRIQRTSGMRSHTQVSAQADFPIDLTAIPGAFVGELNTMTQSTGSIRDGRNNQAMLDEEARRRLYAAY